MSLDVLGDGGVDLDSIQKLLEGMKNEFGEKFVLR